MNRRDSLPVSGEINVGLNGIGRIGKCLLMQLTKLPNYRIRAINCSSLKAEQYADYLRYDSSHKFAVRMGLQKVEVLSPTRIRIVTDHSTNDVTLFSSRDPKELPWRSAGVEYLLDATGAFLTQEKCANHDVDRVVMTAPPKDPDFTSTFIYGVNHELYEGQSIVSASSCTTNCMAPMLKLVQEEFGIKSANFTTIHSTTGSQHVVDVLGSSSRTHRSIINNIIPHSTGASKSVTRVIPSLEGKIWGTSIRVPTINCSLLDCNIVTNDETTTLADIADRFSKSDYYKTVYDINNKNLTSCDFLTTSTPCILDQKASLDMTPGNIKVMLWYDNEWSYSAQCLRLVGHMHKYDLQHTKKSVSTPFKLSARNNLSNLTITTSTNVVARLDFDVPRDSKNNVTDDFLIRSALPTIEYILSKRPNRLVMVCHFGRPKNNDKSKSTAFLVPILQKLLNRSVGFLKNGVSAETLAELKTADEKESGDFTKLFLCENIRFHDGETNYDANSELSALYTQLGDAFVADCFGCAHRSHMSICHLNGNKSALNNFAYGMLIEKEIKASDLILRNNGDKVLFIMGGSKIEDKQPMIDVLSRMNSTRIFVGGALTNKWASHFPITPRNVVVAKDAYGDAEADGDEQPTYIKSLAENDEDTTSKLKGFDIGPVGLRELMNEIDNANVIFWNGSLGVIEDDRYRNGSQIIVDYLKSYCKEKVVVVGGGQTASMFVNSEERHIHLSTGGGALLGHIRAQLLLDRNSLPGLTLFESK